MLWSITAYNNLNNKYYFNIIDKNIELWNKFNEDLKNNSFQKFTNYLNKDGVINNINIINNLKDNFQMFLEYAENFSKINDGGILWFRDYEHWLKAFIHASNNGFIELYENNSFIIMDNIINKLK